MIKPEHVISIGTLILAGVAQLALKPKQKRGIITIVLIGVGLMAFIVGLFRDEIGNAKNAPGITTYGNNSPVTIQQASPSGGSTVNQAGRDLTINNVVVASDAVLHAVLKRKLTRYAQEYPLGFVLF